MKNNAPTFVIIGKPNNGKSSMISALTFDDRIKVSKEVGTTTVSTLYSYNYKDETICNFFDTPGFEEAKDIWKYIKKNKDENSYGNNILRSFISDFNNENRMKKDIEILKAVLESDFIILVVDVSENFNLNTIGHQLEIIRFIKKPILVLFNKIGTNDYSNSWTKMLTEYGFSETYNVNPLTSNYTNIADIYKNLYRINSTVNEKQSLDYLLRVNNKHIKENVDSSAKIIAQMILEILQIEDISRKFTGSITKEDKKNALLKYQNKIYDLENAAKKDIAKTWGYHQVKVKDEREEFNSDTSIELGVTKKRLVSLGAAIGALGGAVFGLPFVILGVGISTTVVSVTFGTLLGGSSAYLMANKYHKILISDKKIIHRMNKKAYNTSFILLKRSLEYLHRLMRHGHANRTDIIISKIVKEWKFNNEWNFNGYEEKKIAKIHTYIVEDKDTIKNRDELSQMIVRIIEREMT